MNRWPLACILYLFSRGGAPSRRVCGARAPQEQAGVAWSGSPPGEGELQYGILYAAISQVRTGASMSPAPRRVPWKGPDGD